MMTRPLGKTGFSIAPLVFGGNVFGWTIDEKTSFALLDAFVDHGCKFFCQSGFSAAACAADTNK